MNCADDALSLFPISLRTNCQSLIRPKIKINLSTNARVGAFILHRPHTGFKIRATGQVCMASAPVLKGGPKELICADDAPLPNKSHFLKEMPRILCSTLLTMLS